jgi:hypothetical protein
MRTILLFLAMGFAASCADQSFEVASVKVSPMGSKGGERAGEKIDHSPVGVTMSNVSLPTCIEWAYNVREFQIVGAPGWFSEQGFDIVAKTGTEVSEEALRAMMKTLLADRFRLAVRRERRELPVYKLVVTKAGHKLRRSVSMQDFADRLARRPLHLDRPVLDSTGLDGAWDFELRLADNASGLKSSLEGMERGDPDAPFRATLIQEQLGLRLDASKGLVDVVVVERANRVPTGN